MTKITFKAVIMAGCTRVSEQYHFYSVHHIGIHPYLILIFITGISCHKNRNTQYISECNQFDVGCPFLVFAHPHQVIIPFFSCFNKLRYVTAWGCAIILTYTSRLIIIILVNLHITCSTYYNWLWPKLIDCHFTQFSMSVPMKFKPLQLITDCMEKTISICWNVEPQLKSSLLHVLSKLTPFTPKGL